MRTFILVNTLQAVNSFVYANHIDFACYNAKRYPDDLFFWNTPHRQTIDKSRNEAAIQALHLECDYLMFIDDDVMVPKNTFELLKNTDKDIIAALVYLRGYPFHTMAFKRLYEDEKADNQLRLTYYDDWEQNIDSRGLVKVAAVGFSCCLVKCDVLKAMEPPYFITGPHNTEDVYFCLKTRELDPLPEIYLNPNIKCGHLLNPEPIEYETRDLQIAYCEGIVKRLQQENNNMQNLRTQNPRTIEYIRRNVKNL